MKRVIFTIVFITAALMLIDASLAGDLNPPATPAPTMKTLQEIYDELQLIKQYVLNSGSTYCRDADGDGFGDPNDAKVYPTQPNGYVSDCKDCDDNNVQIYPGNQEIAGDNIDNNCNGIVDEETAKRVFVTSTTYGGNLSGLNGADGICQAIANQNGFGGTWKAWLSDSNTSAESRLTHSQMGYVRIDGVEVASSWDELVGGQLSNPISNEAGAVWTGTEVDGSSGTYNCNDWSTTDPVSDGGFGIANRSDSSWSAAGSYECDSQHGLYCFEQ